MALVLPDTTELELSSGDKTNDNDMNFVIIYKDDRNYNDDKTL